MNRIEKVKAARITGAATQEAVAKMDASFEPWVIELLDALRDALPVIEAAMEDIPCTGPIGESAWLKRLDAALTPWKEKEEDAQS